MHIRSFEVRNFRAITQLALSDLRGTVVIAGPNGCGKSCVFDAIRLLKSVSKVLNPTNGRIGLASSRSILASAPLKSLVLFQDGTSTSKSPLKILLSSEELGYLRSNAKALQPPPTRSKRSRPNSVTGVIATPIAWHLCARTNRRSTHKLQRYCRSYWRRWISLCIREGYSSAPMETCKHIRRASWNLSSANMTPRILESLITMARTATTIESRLEALTLNIEESEQRLRQHALYNYSNKYANLKTEMASSSVRHLLSAKADPKAERDERPFSRTLKEALPRSSPAKNSSPRATSSGGLQFPVRLGNDASTISMSKVQAREVVHSYLVLRNEAPKHSVILIDQPELHLNPRLISGLASFYHRHLGRSLDNQLWLVTHSDTLIREAVGQDGFSVFHMQAPGAPDIANQVTPVEIARDLERLVIELVEPQRIALGRRWWCWKEAAIPSLTSG